MQDLLPFRVKFVGICPIFGISVYCIDSKRQLDVLGNLIASYSNLRLAFPVCSIVRKIPLIKASHDVCIPKL
jgi:hypothetical protein